MPSPRKPSPKFGVTARDPARYGRAYQEADVVPGERWAWRDGVFEALDPKGDEALEAIKTHDLSGNTDEWVYAKVIEPGYTEKTRGYVTGYPARVIAGMPRVLDASA